MLIVAPYPESLSPEDRLVCARWVAQQTQLRLQQEGVMPVMLEGSKATRVALEKALPQDGIAFFAHGTEHSIAGCGEDLLDRENLPQFGGVWIHAFACFTGVELAKIAVEDANVPIFIGYNIQLVVDWSPEAIPAALLPDFIRLCTEITSLLSLGVRNKKLLQQAVYELSDRVILWLGEHQTPENQFEFWALMTLGSRLSTCMVIESAI
jgi:hypothetical protein